MVEDDLGKLGFCADGARVGEVFAPQVIWVVAEDVALAGCGSGLGFDAEEDGDVLVGVQTVCDEEGNDHDVWELGESVPFSNERCLFHVGVEYLAEDGELADLFDFTLCGESGVVIEVGAVTDDEEAGLIERERPGDFAGAL